LQSASQTPSASTRNLAGASPTPRKWSVRETPNGAIPAFFGTHQITVDGQSAGDVQANLELGIIAATDHRTADAQRYFLRASPQSRAAEVDLQILKNGGATPNRAVLPSPAPNVDAQVALAMAQRYHRGLGVPANFSEAIRFYRLAADRGSQQAKRMLALIYSRPMPNGSINTIQV